MLYKKGSFVFQLPFDLLTLFLCLIVWSSLRIPRLHKYRYWHTPIKNQGLCRNSLVSTRLAREQSCFGIALERQIIALELIEAEIDLASRLNIFYHYI